MLLPCCLPLFISCCHAAIFHAAVTLERWMLLRHALADVDMLPIRRISPRAADFSATTLMMLLLLRHTLMLIARHYYATPLMLLRCLLPSLSYAIHMPLIDALYDGYFAILRYHAASRLRLRLSCRHYATRQMSHAMLFRYTQRRRVITPQPMPLPRCCYAIDITIYDADDIMLICCAATRLCLCRAAMPREAARACACSLTLLAAQLPLRDAI